MSEKKHRPAGHGRAARHAYPDKIQPNPSRNPRNGKPRVASELRLDPRFRHLVDRLHALGPRPTGELLAEIVAGRDVLEALSEYASLTPDFVAAMDGTHWPRPVLVPIQGGRP